MSMHQALVSVLMPVKNTAVFLSECLDSILAQSYQHWELIAVDDHSTDTSADLLQKYANQDPRIQVWKNKGVGIISALQLAYDKSKGRFITRMDSDDKMTVDKLALLVNALQQKGKRHIAVGWVEYFSQTALGDGYLKYAQWLNSCTQSASNFDHIYKECSIPSPCWMINRTDFEACGAFRSDIYPEDYDLAFRFRKEGLKIAPVTSILHLWRDYATRTSRTDEHYADNRFLSLKVHHFLSQDYQNASPLIVWGAGRKGKKIAQLFSQKKIPFHWICNNEKKIGHNIYGVHLSALSSLEQIAPAQVIVAIHAKDAMQAINELVQENDQHQYFWWA